MPFWKSGRLEALIILSVFAAFGLIYIAISPQDDTPRANSCAQPLPITPSRSFANSSQFLTSSYEKHSVDLLAGAVQIPTVSFDDMSHNVTADPRFEIFLTLHKYLLTKFPLVAEYAETINTYGLLYTIPGTDKTLKPVVVMAHQDVVPVNKETENKWTYPPFSGHFDGDWLWGRGASDIKNSLIAELEALENLLAQKWQPKRTVILASGFDEESEGTRGAKTIAAELHQRYGQHGVEVIVDEGSALVYNYGALFALPAVAEKGRVYFDIDLDTPGGHSSIPPDHTGIGIISQLAVNLEADPFKSHIQPNGPIDRHFSCIAAHAPDLSSQDRSLFAHAGNNENLITHLDKTLFDRYFIRTSQALDVVRGGVKVNALPEKVVLQVDHRIAIDSSIEFVKDRLLHHVKKLANQFTLDAYINGDKFVSQSSSKGTLHIQQRGNIDPAPISPDEGTVWDLVAGTSRHVFDSVIEHKYGPLTVAPTVMWANTDTAHYWNVSQNIYRYNPVFAEDLVDFHTVDEKLRFRSHISAVVWFYEFLLNAAS